jgi:ParB/RepB/Spo0J family partition protein
MTDRELKVPVDRIRVVENGMRAGPPDEGIEGLAATIRSYGLLHPLTVSEADDEGFHTLRCGHRRLQAAKLAGLTMVPVRVSARSGPLDLALEQLIENLQRSDPDAMQLARFVRRTMREGDLTGQRLGELIGRSSAWVTRLVALTELQPEVQTMVEQGTLSPSAAYELTKVDDPWRQLELAREAAEGSLTRDRLSARLAGRTNPSGAAARRFTCPLPGGVRLNLTTAAGLTLDGLIESFVTLLNEARKARQRGLDAGALARVLKARFTAQEGDLS